MSLTDTLPDVGAPEAAGPRDGTVQWRLELLQVVNWGGFSGVHTLHVDRISTLLSGQSGTGKSTLLDANIALLMPASTAFNGASNATGGRVRGEEQRSLLSYLRGQIDTTTDVENVRRAKVLRGADGHPTWGAIAGRFISDTGHRFTAVRMYYVPAGASRDGDIVRRMATYDGALDVAALEPLAGGRFTNQSVKAAFPGVATHETYGAYIDRVCTRLGIGAGGDGAKALDLLARIQAGRQIRTVDDLYKAMVLEEPATFAAADLALSHFDELDDTYQKMAVERAKQRILEPLPELHEQLIGARATLEQIQALGLGANTPSPLSAWEANHEIGLARTAEAAVATERGTCNGELIAARAASASATTAHREALQAFDAGGGKRLLAIDAEILTAEQDKVRRDSRRANLEVPLRQLGLGLDDLATSAQYDQLLTQGRQFDLDSVTLDKKLDDKLTEQAGVVYQAKVRVREVEAELKSASKRPGRVPEYLDEQRMEVCAATGLAREQLPFVAELLEVPTTEEKWRTAIEVSLSGVARVMLVPADRIAAVSAVIDKLAWKSRMRFEAAGTHLPIAPRPDVSTVAGKLIVADSPFAGWVSTYIGDPRRNATCVLDAVGLIGPGLRVTLAGQTRSGSSYAHGRDPKQRNIIGFDNVAGIAEMETDLDRLRGERDAAQAAYDTLADERSERTKRRAAYQSLAAYPFVDIDVAGCDEAIARLTAERNALRETNDVLSALADALEKAQKKLEKATKEVGRLEGHLEALDVRWNKISGRVDTLADILTEHENVGDVDEAAIAKVRLWWEQATTPASRDRLEDWEDNRTLLRQRIAGEQTTAESGHATAVRSVERILASYQEQYYDPNLTASVDSLPDFLAIFDQIGSTGLAQRTQQWRDRLLRWSGEDLVPLTQAMTNAVEEIKARLHPINDILRKLDFGPTADRLKIELRHTPSPSVLEFRRRLSELSSGATKEQLPPEQMSARFKELKEFMALMRSDKDPRVDRNVANRDKLLDVRQHVHVTAHRLGSDGQILSTYASLGGKSGGETQELIAFIIGAALRYRLGDQLRDRPRFAPVVLDEAFIKADAEFSGRAVQAWLELGFQLIIGAPTDKVGALEPHMRSIVSVAKDHKRSTSHLAVLTDASATRSATP